MRMVCRSDAPLLKAVPERRSGPLRPYYTTVYASAYILRQESAHALTKPSWSKQQSVPPSVSGVGLRRRTCDEDSVPTRIQGDKVDIPSRDYRASKIVFTNSEFKWVIFLVSRSPSFMSFLLVSGEVPPANTKPLGILEERSGDTLRNRISRLIRFVPPGTWTYWLMS
ncbi:hypothetical protein J6590_018154 [Homalodisca vitripennis]|nr:hypothetical protein J6590_018154 [Homalodisca vitripennis]